MKDPWRIASQQPEVRDIKETSHLYGRWWKDISLRVKRWKDFSSSWKTPSFCFLYFSFFLLKKKKLCYVVRLSGGLYTHMTSYSRRNPTFERLLNTNIGSKEKMHGVASLVFSASLAIEEKNFLFCGLIILGLLSLPQ